MKTLQTISVDSSVNHLCPLCVTGKPEFSFRAQLYPGCDCSVSECSFCQAAFFWPVPDPEAIARCYPHSYFRDFFKQYWKDYYKGRAVAGSIAAWKTSGSFLDVGCALGTLLAGVRDYSQWKVFGLEYSPAAAEGGKLLHNMDIVNAGLSAAPWSDGSFDYIYANNVLEHESDPFAAMKSAARLLKSGGRLHLTLPNGPVDSLPNRILYRREGKVVVTRHSGHIFFYSRRSLEILLKRAGFSVLWIKNFHFKTALKAHGWTPNAYKQFQNDPADHPAAPENDLHLDRFRDLIPPRPSWLKYYLQYKWHRLWRWHNSDWGYDYEILAEKT